MDIAGYAGFVVLCLLANIYYRAASGDCCCNKDKEINLILKGYQSYG